ncbi:MAG: short-chain dehydrogenase [Dehalococcoidia bacterium]|nr:short-chain dehydrogenase [Dehalococcoidia bacterium]
MDGKVCLVTGANSGIGKAVSLGLAHMGATVVLICRSQSRGAAALAEIKQRSGNSSVSLLVADLSSQHQIRRVASEYQQQYNRLDVLVNNAAVARRKRRVNENGLELTFAVNHLAPFLLTSLLLDLLKASAPARVVTVSSGAHFDGTINFADLQAERRYSPLATYSQSKLANVVFTYELSRRLEGTGVTANSVHPGFVATNIFRDAPLWMRAALGLVRPFILSPDQGADTVLYLATAPEVAEVSGRYFEKRKSVVSSVASRDADTARRLWEVSERLTTVSAHTAG